MSILSKHHFWVWFKRRNQEYLDLDNKSKNERSYWINELKAHLRSYFKFLECFIDARKKESSVLAITVMGKTKHFKKCEAMADKAPDIPGWTIQALMDPQPIDFRLEELIEESGIDPREMYFHFTDPDIQHITVYHPLYTQANANLLSRVAYFAIYNLLGERSFGTDIGEIEITNLSLANPRKIAKLETLPECLSLLNSSTTVDGKGNLRVPMYRR